MDILDLTYTLKTMVPKDYYNKRVGKKEYKKIVEAVDALEVLTTKYGVGILNPDLKTMVDGQLLERQIVITKLKSDRTLNEALKTKALNQLESTILTEGLWDKAKEWVGGIKDWLSVAVDEAKRVILTFARAMGGFGKALVIFLKRIITDVNLKAAWLMVKDLKFVELAKSIGSWLIRRVTDFGALYKSLYNSLHEGIFGNLAGTTPVVKMRLWVQEHAQDHLDALFHPDTGNAQIREIITTKYLESAEKFVAEKYKDEPIESIVDRFQKEQAQATRAQEAWIKARNMSTNDKEILKLMIMDKGFLATAAGKMLMVGLGALLAWLYWEVWLQISFIGDVEYDYSFEQAYIAIKGDFNIANWFLSNDGGFQTLFILLATKMGMPSFGIGHTETNIMIAAVLTVIILWKKNNPEAWEKIKDTEFCKEVVESYQESKQYINNEVQGSMGAFFDKIDELLSMDISKLFIKPTTFKTP